MNIPYLFGWSKSACLQISYFLLLFSLASSQNNNTNICQTKECSSAAKHLKESIDTNTNPCDDFYQYACGNYPNAHKVYNLMPQSTIKFRKDETDGEILDFLRQNNSKDEPEAVHKARKLFSLCQNDAFYSNKLEPIESMLQKIGLPVLAFLSDENENFDYTKALAKATRLAGIKLYFDIGTQPNPYNRTVNMIGLSKPQLTLDPDIMPLTDNFERSHVSKREADPRPISQVEYMMKVTDRMCKDNGSTSCQKWTSPQNFLRDLMAEIVTQQNSESTLLIAGPSTTINSQFPVPVIYTLKQLQNFTDSIAIEVNTTIPKLNWTKYIEEIYSGLDNVTLDLSDPNKIQIAIAELDFVKNMVQFIYKRKTIKHIEMEIWWKVVSTLLPYADLEMFHTKIRVGGLDGMMTREQRCADITVASFGMAVSYLYATKDKYVKAKTEIRKMFEHIRKNLKEIIKEVPWMDETTRQKALIKLNSLKSYIVYPNVIKATSSLNDFYGNVQITDNFYDTMISKIQNQISKTLKRLNEMNDLYEDNWAITPNLVNAIYDQNTNTLMGDTIRDSGTPKLLHMWYDGHLPIPRELLQLKRMNWPQKISIKTGKNCHFRDFHFIPAGILGGSIYNNSLRALDYGAIGSVIGHEATHAFDNQGRRFNDLGNIEDWWQPETLNLYREKAKCFVQAYNNYSTTLGGITQKVDSKATLGEDISDNGGFKEALFAYRNSVSESGIEPSLPSFENFTHDQLFTLSFANLWCESPTRASLILNKYMVHSPNGVRVNGVLRNSKEFSDIWKCPKGSNMNPTVDKCLLW